MLEKTVLRFREPRPDRVRFLANSTSRRCRRRTHTRTLRGLLNSSRDGILPDAFGCLKYRAAKDRSVSDLETRGTTTRTAPPLVETGGR